jgi:hypothetical protein
MRQLLLVTAVVLASNLASAGSSTTTKPVALVNERLLQPLAVKEREQSKFSRARLPPSERRVRVLDDKPQQDSAGDAFYAFAIDARYGWAKDTGDDNWTKATMTGCVYPARGEVFFKRGDAYYPAAAVLGKKVPSAPDAICHAAAQLSAR